MDYYLVTINIAENDSLNTYKRNHHVCATLKTALRCAKHWAYVYNFKPLYENKKLNKWKWDDIGEYWYKNYWQGYIKISKKQMWEKEWDID